MTQKKNIRIKTPAKINLSLEILNRTDNGFHLLSSVMQTVSLYDYLTFNLSDTNNKNNEIILTGNSDKIPYNEKNIVYKVLKLYLDEIQAENKKIEIHIEKNIPTEAGLAGGSTNGAGALMAVNNLFDNVLSSEKIHSIAAQTGSDLNFCLKGGACLLSSRGEIIDEKLPFRDYKIIVVKPKNISISTKLCYQKFSKNFFKEKKSVYSSKISELFKNDFNTEKLSEFLYNDLEKPAISMHPEIEEIKNKLKDYGCYNALMSGSGSSVFGLIEDIKEIPFDDNFEVFYLNATSQGAEIL